MNMVTADNRYHVAQLLTGFSYFFNQLLRMLQ